MAELDNEELRRLKDVNMDEAPARRHVRDCFRDIQHNLDHILIKTPGDGIKTKESYEVNSRGFEIFSKSWLPESSRPRALVCFCHGIARRLALSGYGVFAMDYPGFGLSEGLHGYISSFDLLVEDVIEHYSNIKEKPEFSSLPSFLFGQSMGGAVSLKIHFKQPNAWTGAVLVAPMCKIAEDMVPPPVLKHILIGLSSVLPKHKLVPQKDLTDAAFRDVTKRKLLLLSSFDRPPEEKKRESESESGVATARDGAPAMVSSSMMLPVYPSPSISSSEASWKHNKKFAKELSIEEEDHQLRSWFLHRRCSCALLRYMHWSLEQPAASRNVMLHSFCAPYNVICYCDKPRLRTAVEMLRTTQEIEQQLHKVCLPILILHGEADRMTDPSVSRDLYEKAKSSDKKIVLYKDAYHSLLEGEPDEVILLVLSDIISWLDDHSLQVEGS
ncbi:hypothetical protein YC2023_123654 [Brassica napus]